MSEMKQDKLCVSSRIQLNSGVNMPLFGLGTLQHLFDMYNNLR